MAPVSRILRGSAPGAGASTVMVLVAMLTSDLWGAFEGGKKWFLDRTVDC